MQVENAACFGTCTHARPSSSYSDLQQLLVLFPLPLKLESKLAFEFVLKAHLRCARMLERRRWMCSVRGAHVTNASPALDF